MTPGDVAAQAHQDYGDLVEQVTVWPDGGANVSLIGGDLVTYLPDGRQEEIVFGQTLRGQVGVAWARCRGYLRAARFRLLHGRSRHTRGT